MNRRVWSSFPKPQGVFIQTTTLKLVYGRRGLFPLLSRVPNSCQLGIDPWRAQSSATILLHKPSLSRCWGQVPADREDGFLFNCRVKEASSIFLGSYHLGHNGPTHPEIHEQAWCSRENGSMGHWAKPVRYWVQATNCYQSLGISRLYCWVHHDRSRPEGRVLDDICKWVICCRSRGCRRDHLFSWEGMFLDMGSSSSSRLRTMKQSMRQFSLA